MRDGNTDLGKSDHPLGYTRDPLFAAFNATETGTPDPAMEL